MEKAIFELYNYLGKEIYVTYYILGYIKSKKLTLTSINENLGIITVYNKYEKTALCLPFRGISMCILSIRLNSKKEKPIYFNKYIYGKTLDNLSTDEESVKMITNKKVLKSSK